MLKKLLGLQDFRVDNNGHVYKNNMDQIKNKIKENKIKK